jgi:hypothetical protein
MDLLELLARPQDAINRYNILILLVEREGLEPSTPAL